MNNASSLIEVAYSETYLPKDAVDNLEMALSEGRERREAERKERMSLGVTLAQANHRGVWTDDER